MAGVRLKNTPNGVIIHRVSDAPTILLLLAFLDRLLPPWLACTASFLVEQVFGRGEEGQIWRKFAQLDLWVVTVSEPEYGH